MKLTLKARVEKKISARVKSGKYDTPEDVVAAAIMTLDQQEKFGDFAPGELNAFIAKAEQDIKKNGTLDGDYAYQLRRKRYSQ